MNEVVLSIVGGCSTRLGVRGDCSDGQTVLGGCLGIVRALEEAVTVVGDCSERRFGIRDGCSNSLWIGCSARRLSVRDGSQKIKTHQ